MKIVSIDVETADWGYPCEIGIAEIIDGKIVSSKSWLVKPSCFPKMNAEHQAIHGITNEQLEHAPTFKEIWSELKPYIEGVLLVAHNVKFDIDCIVSEMQRHRIKTKPLHGYCTCLQAREHLNIPSHKLDAVCKHLGIEIGNHHRAEHDAIAAAKIHLALPKRGVKMIIRSV